MNEGMYIAFRSYLEEHSSLLRQILEELKALKDERGTVFYPKVTVTRDLGNLGPISADTGEPIRAKPKTTPKKGK